MKRHLIYIALLLMVVCSAHGQTQAAKKVENKKAFTVVIDAGHGGKDPGAVGKIAQEKMLNLDVSLLLGSLIEENYPEVKVLYTRKTDVFLTLQERANFVNKNAADLFVCIHTNATKGASAKGAEVFVLGTEKMGSNLDVAMRENAVMLLDDDQTAYEGFDPNSIDSYIMFELMQDQYIDQSLQYAQLVQNEFAGTLKRADRGVRQAGFWVLHKSACPSVLVEMGFISNPDEEKYLASQQGKDDMAKAMFDAFVSYKASIDKKNGQTPRVVKLEKSASALVKEKQEKVENKVVEKKEPEQTVEKEIKDEEQPSSEAEKPVYRVQIFSTTKELKSGDATFKGLKGCKYTRDGKFYKYTYGEESNYESILELQKTVKEKFKDCFIVAFLGGKQILVKDARAM